MKQTSILVQDQTGTQFRVSQMEWITRGLNPDHTTIVSLDGKQKFDVKWANRLDDMKRPVYQTVHTSLDVPQFTEMFGQRWNIVKDKLEWTDEAPAELARPLAEAVHLLLLAVKEIRNVPTMDASILWDFLEDSSTNNFKRVQECLDKYLDACRKVST